MVEIQFGNINIVGDNVPDYIYREIEKLKELQKLGFKESLPVETKVVKRGSIITIPKGYYICKVRDRNKPIKFKEFRRYILGNPTLGTILVKIPKRFKYLFVVYNKSLTSKGVRLYICQ